MKKELITLTFLSTIIVLVYFLFPDFQDNRKKKDDNSFGNENVISEETIKDIVNDDEFVPLTFDIVRITKQGDAVVAGKSVPNVQVQLLDDGKKIAEFFSDVNGEWVWVSDFPLGKGLRSFRLKYIDKDGKEHMSDQTVVILNDNDKVTKPIVVKFLSNDHKNLDILNLDSLDNGLSLDLVDYAPDGKLAFSGRTLPNNEIRFIISNKLLGTSMSNEFGNWKFISNIIDLSSNHMTIITKINNQELSLQFNQLDLNKSLDFQNLSQSKKKFVVESGNSLWRIARKTMGGGVYYTEIFKNNLKQIKDPDKIFPGQVLNIPNVKKILFYE
ncbi:MAG: LysM peptidoglycan-binding domain-containing protein [Pseudomonadota bacterium]|nr:LysM peptidoglycan-binding domain-containing protein [Pseudomonadota bacterium]